MPNVTRDELKQLIDSGRDFTLIDALPAELYGKEHLPRAVSMPADEIHGRAAKELPNKNKLIVTYCGNSKCPKSREAAETLKSLGYTNVSEFSGGIDEWRTAGLPLESNTPAEGTYGNGQTKRTVGSSAT